MSSRERTRPGNRGLILDDKDVLLLLRAAVEREGSITSFAKRHGLDRGNVSNILSGKRSASGPLVKALGLRKVIHT